MKTNPYIITNFCTHPRANHSPRKW